PRAVPARRRVPRGHHDPPARARVHRRAGRAQPQAPDPVTPRAPGRLCPAVLRPPALVSTITAPVLAILLAGAALTGSGCGQRDADTRPIAAARAGCPKGQRDCLPDLGYIDTTGAAYPRDALLGKVVLVNFWATWCEPCEKEIPDLSRAYQKYRSRGVVFLGVLIDNPDSQKLLNF